MTDLTERLRKLLNDATPGDLSTAERHTENETIECPLCHEGEVEASDYCNIDGKALGVQFYGIGEEFGAHERLWSETLAALPDLLTTLETITQENARLRAAGWRDIESAPKDGTRFLAYWRGLGFGSEDTIAICSWDAPGTSCEHWTVDGRWTPGDDPTHWMPLPPAPARKALGGGDE